VATLDRQDDVFVIDFGDDQNQTHVAWVDEMNALLDEVEKAEAPAALVLTGRGKFFSAGLDTDYMAANPDQVMAYVHRVEQVVARILVAPLPTIAAVNGHAFGIGAFLVIAADQAVMREDRGWVCWPEIDLGMAFPRQMLALGRARLDPRALHEAFSSGRRYTATEAIAAGFVAESAPEAQVLARASQRVAPLAKQAGETLGRIKRQLHGAVLEAGR
jgi:enoyl-CoA hydratase/carnithine racemase